MKQKIIPVLIVFALVFVIVGGITLSFLIQKMTPTKERQDLNEYFKVSSEEEAAIVLDHMILESKARIHNGNVFLSYDFVHDFINSRFYWDENENILFYTTASDVISANADSSDYSIGKSKESFGHTIVMASAESAWIHVGFVEKFSNITFTLEENPSRVVITKTWGEITTVTAKKDTVIRYRGGIKSPILADVEKTEKLTVVENEENWTKVANAHGIIGYVRNKDLSAQQTETLTHEFTEETVRHNLRDFKINLAWHQVTNRAANDNIASVLQSAKGLNVISPTWFYLDDNSGNIANLASSDYVRYCHNQGVEVWALVSNLENSEADSAYVLTHSSTRQNLVNQIVSAAIEYNLDGINLDFEELSQKNVGDAFIQFVRELSIKLHNNDILLSVDNYPPAADNSFYNRKEQAFFADYVIIMAYNEHTNLSEAPGSVASLSWVKDAVTNTLREVPAEQFILAMPFYTRIWEQTPIEGEEEGVVTYDMTSSVYGMDSSQREVSNYTDERIWDDECGQYYASYTKGEVLYQVWFETSESMEERLKVMKENQLAGAAFWKLGFDGKGIWDTILKYMN